MSSIIYIFFGVFLCEPRLVHMAEREEVGVIIRNTSVLSFETIHIPHVAPLVVRTSVVALSLSLLTVISSIYIYSSKADPAAVQATGPTVPGCV